MLNTFRKFLNKNILLSKYRSYGRAFSTVSGLKNCLKNEIKDMQKSYEPVAENEKQDFLKEKRWVIFEKENSDVLELKKSIDEYDLVVRFNSKPPEVSNEERGKGDPERILDFYVTISKNGKTSGVLLECVTMDSSVNINQIHFSEEIATYTNNYFSAVVNENYSGPEFKTLDERLQQEFLELFIQLGIDDNLGSFIEVISVDKDQRLYINWLKNVEKTLI